MLPLASATLLLLSPSLVFAKEQTQQAESHFKIEEFKVDAGDKSVTHRPAVVVITDPENGCQYIAFLSAHSMLQGAVGGITPRLKPNGDPLCTEKIREQSINQGSGP